MSDKYVIVAAKDLNVYDDNVEVMTEAQKQIRSGSGTILVCKVTHIISPEPKIKSFVSILKDNNG